MGDDDDTRWMSNGMEGKRAELRQSSRGQGRNMYQKIRREGDEIGQEWQQREAEAGGKSCDGGRGQWLLIVVRWWLLLVAAGGAASGVEAIRIQSRGTRQFRRGAETACNSV
jgi:hypothetical protein